MQSERQSDGGNLYTLKEGSVEVVFYESHTDKRNFPRLKGGRYINIELLIKEIFIENDLAMDENEIIEKLTQKIIKLKEKEKGLWKQ